MDTRLNGVSPVTSAAPARIEAAPVRQAVRTELPAPNAVAAQAGVEQSRWNRSRALDVSALPHPVGLQTSVAIEPQSGDFIFRLIDPASGTAILQYPSESIMKLRAYVRTLESAQHAPAPSPITQA